MAIFDTPLSPAQAEEAASELYRALLKREPDEEGMKLYARRINSFGLASVVREFLASDEYCQHSLVAPSLDLNWGPSMPVQTELPSDQLDTLWQHVQQVWTNLGVIDPFWSVLSSEKYRKPNMDDQSTLEDFYASGISDINYLKAYLNRSGLSLGPDIVAAEYGCGLGRVTRYLAHEVGSVIAFDISASHLEAARERLHRDEIKNVEFVHVNERADLSKMKGIKLFFSLIVLQHNPPPVIIDILKVAFNSLTQDGIAFFQVPVYSKNYSFSAQEYLKTSFENRSMEMHFLSQKAIFQLAKENGMRVLEVRSDHWTGHFDSWISNTFLMRKE